MLDENKRSSVQEIAAAVTAILLVLTISVCAVLVREVPNEVAAALGAAITWLFTSAVQRAETRATASRQQATSMNNHQEEIST